MDELVRSVRSGILLDVSTLPTVGMTDRHGQVRLRVGRGARLSGQGCKGLLGKQRGEKAGREGEGALPVHVLACATANPSAAAYNSKLLPCVQPVPLNRYALDYFKHGQKVALVEANGLREGDAWQARKHRWLAADLPLHRMPTAASLLAGLG